MFSSCLVTDMTMKTLSEGFRPAEVYKGVLDVEVQEKEIWQIARMLPHTTVYEIREKLQNLARDQHFVMNYWLKVCKVRALRGLPMPWERVH